MKNTKQNFQDGNHEEKSQPEWKKNYGTLERSFAQFCDDLQLKGSNHIRDAAHLPTIRRIGKLAGHKALCARQQKESLRNYAICRAMQILQENIRKETNNPSFRFSVRKLDDLNIRRKIKEMASRFVEENIYLAAPRGGLSKSWVLYKGRTLREYLTKYESTLPNESAIDAVTSLRHRQGNRRSRLDPEIYTLILKAIEEKGTGNGQSHANIYNYFKDIIREVNMTRDVPLAIPTQATLTYHINKNLTPVMQEIARNGIRETRNTQGAGSTDIPAVFIGERVEIDECKLSLITISKASDHWETLTEEQKKIVRRKDNELRSRMTLLVMIDVATRMPLAWVLSMQPGQDVTKEALRMASRDKTREKVLYGCTNNPAPAISIETLIPDNGTGLRNSAIASTSMENEINLAMARAYNATDKSTVEPFFGTHENVLLKNLPGYTGRRPGDLPGADPMKEAIIDLPLLRKLITRFMIDEYPSLPHRGFGHFGRRPQEVFNELYSKGYVMKELNPIKRRLSLGIKETARVQPEGVCVYGYLWFNSSELQEIRVNENFNRKVTIYIDPDDLSVATVVIENRIEPVTVQLQCTYFASMTLPEVTDLITVFRAENPEVTEIYEATLHRVRTERKAELDKLAIERNGPNGFQTLDQIRKNAMHVVHGARIISTGEANVFSPACPPPSGVMSRGISHPNIHTIEDAIEVEAHVDVMPSDVVDLDGAEAPKPKAMPKRKSSAAKSQPEDSDKPMGKPRNPKALL